MMSFSKYDKTYVFSFFVKNPLKNIRRCHFSYIVTSIANDESGLLRKTLGLFANEISVCSNSVGIFGFRMQGRFPSSLVATLLAQHLFQGCRSTCTTGHKTSQASLSTPSHQLPMFVLPPAPYSLLLCPGLPLNRPLVPGFFFPKEVIFPISAHKFRMFDSISRVILLICWCPVPWVLLALQTFSIKSPQCFLPNISKKCLSLP